MKKLMIAAAIVCAAAFAQAATIKWDVDSSWQPGTTTYINGWQAYFFDNATVARDSMIAAIEGGDYTSLLASGKAANDLLGDGTGYAEGSSLKTTYGNPETMNGYIVIFNAEEAADATLAYVAELKPATTGATSGQAGTIHYGDLTGTKTAANWTTVGGDVPEPTSGLLLLLGVAGLALKRRRA